MSIGRVEVSSFKMLRRDPFLDALIGLVSEPQGSATADHASTTTREWWDKYGRGPSCDELLSAMFAPDDWLEVLVDPSRTSLEQRSQVELLRSWLVHYWSRLGAISFVAGHDSVVRPGRPIPVPAL